MATITATGDIQLEPGDILPRKVAVRNDDPPQVRELIEELNPTIVTAEDLAAAIEKVDALRRELATKVNEDNPHIAESVDEQTESK